MNPNNTSKGIEPPIPASPEDDPKLQAIEALEARPEDLEAKPIPTPQPTIPSTPPTPIAPAAPVTPPPVTPPVPVVATPKVVVTETIPKKTQAESPKIPSVPETIASKMAAELANSPPTFRKFQFFLTQKVSKTPLVIGISIIVFIIVGVIGYILLHPQG